MLPARLLWCFAVFGPVLWGQPPRCAAREAVSVPLSVVEPSGVERRGWPMTSGIPFARGALRDATGARLTDAAGAMLPVQTRVTCRWPDGSVKWLLLDTQVDLDATQLRACRLEFGLPVSEPGPQMAPGLVSLTVEQLAEVVRVNTGPLGLKIPRGGPGLVGAVCFDGDGDGRHTDDERLSDAPWVLRLVTADGMAYTSDPLAPEVEIEESGLLRACVRIAGRLADARKRPAFRYVVRLHLFAGRPFVRAHVTLIVDVPDREMADVRSFALVVPVTAGGARRVMFGPSAAGAEGVHVLSDGAGHRLFQQDDQRYLLDGRPAGARAAGWVDADGPGVGLAAGVRHFWQQWPQALHVADDGVHVELVPSFEKETYAGGESSEQARWTYALREGAVRLKQGVAKTFEVWVLCHPGGMDGRALDAFYRQAFEPLLATCDPAYICGTQALGDFAPAGTDQADGFPGIDALLARGFEAHLKRREAVREYGLLNYGDWWGERGMNWGNLEYDMPRGLIAQYARTGNRAYYLRAAEAARHHVDVDIVHAVNEHLQNPNHPRPQVGDTWVHATGHTGGYFEDGAFGLERPYTMGYSRNLGHVWARGDLDYYFLSGDAWAREAALSVADCLRVAYAPHFRIGTHMRDISWPMIAMLAGYRATGRSELLDAVRHGWEVLRDAQDPGGGWTIKLARGHCVHEPTRCQGNVSFIMAIVISSLCDYHRETGDPEVAKAIVGAVDFTIREMYLPDAHVFRYTSCERSITSVKFAPMLAESLSYAYLLTGDSRYLRILRESLVAFQDDPGDLGMGKGISQVLILLPEGLRGLETPAP